MESNIILIAKTLGFVYFFINGITAAKIIRERKFYCESEFRSNLIWFSLLGTVLLLMAGWSTWFKECDEGMSEDEINR